MSKLLLIILLVSSFNTFAWEGYDSENGSYIEIDKGNLVRTGSEIEYYDSSAGEYRTGEVQSIQGYGSSVEVEVLDSDTGEVRTFDMDK